jgi:Asp-tRNA(Asn)/Glu-tRNA(Gln) amidotransferase A subunit family amidase
MSDLTLLSAGQLATAVRGRQVSSEQAIEAYLNHINKHNAELNAIVTLDAGSARKPAKAADYPAGYAAITFIEILIHTLLMGSIIAHLDKRFDRQGASTSVSSVPLRTAA